MKETKRLNRQTIKLGLNQLYMAIDLAMRNALHEAAVWAVNDMATSKGFTGLTGNTQTSYSAAVYHNGKMVDMVRQGVFSRKPVSRKFKFGKRLYLPKPYEGAPRFKSLYGKAQVDNLYGSETAEKNLKSYQQRSQQGWAMMVTTGTEYSEFLEFDLDLNVIGDTYDEAKVKIGLILRNSTSGNNVNIEFNGTSSLGV